MSDFIGWIVLGLIAGGLGKLLMPGHQNSGCLLTTILGVAGAFLGGFLSNYLPFFHHTKNEGIIPSIPSIISASIGAFILLFIFSMLKKKP